MMSSCSTEENGATGCGCGPVAAFDGASAAYRRALTAVIAINLIAFGVVALGSWFAGSAALAANTLDFGADATTYGLSLWVIGRSVRTRTAAAMAKGAALAVMAAATLGFAGWRTVSGQAPDATAISGLGLFGAAANLLGAFLLVRFREGDANVRSVWLCTRNDLIQCLAVAATGLAVKVTGSRWPDLLVGGLLAGIFLRSAWQIVRQASDERRNSGAREARDFATRAPAPFGGQ